MTRRHRITTAVLELLDSEDMDAETIAERINLDGAYKALRDQWGMAIAPNQVYAAMAGLRSKTDPKRNFITPHGGAPGKGKIYMITGYGEKRLRELRKAQEEAVPPPLVHRVLKIENAPPADSLQNHRYALMYRPPCGAWYIHSHKLHDTPGKAREAAAKFLHPDTPFAVVPVPANPVPDR